MATPFKSAADRPDPRQRAAARALLGSVLGLALAGATSSPAAAQSNNPAPDWDPPYCSEQPRITAVYDNDVPTYDRNNRTILYTGRDVRPAPCEFAYDGHSGWDYARYAGRQTCGGQTRPRFYRSLVYAAADGIIRRSRWYTAAHDGRAAAYGLHIDANHVDARHGELSHLYGHLAAVFVHEGERIAQGDVIGAVGNTGNSSGPHLHFQGARGSRGDVSDATFDIFGWNAMFGPGYRYPGFPQPHRGDTWPMRAVTPGEVGPACPGECGPAVIVDDTDPSVVYGCGAGEGLERCPRWRVQGHGYRGQHHWVPPNGPAKDHYVRYRCPQCAPGTYIVMAYVPMGAEAADTHVARYEAAGRLTVLDQHREGDIWHPIGVFSFAGTPSVELSDRSDRYDYTAPSTQKIGADALMFIRVGCGQPEGGGSPATPTPTPLVTPAVTPGAPAEPTQQ